jgi:hypothetical protein
MSKQYVLQESLRLIFIVIIFAVLFFVLTSVYCVYSALFGAHSPPAKFCTLEDEVYQTIVKEAPIWAEEFRSKGRLVDVEIPFKVPNGGEYLVSGDLWDIVGGKPPRLLVVRELGWNERLGSVGYIYSPDGETSFDKYRVKLLAEDVYCYWRESEFTQ